MLKQLWGLLGANGLLIAAAVLLAVGGGSYFKGRSDGIALQKGRQASAEAAARDLADESAGQSAAEAEADNRTLSQAEKERRDAIEFANDGGKPSAASNAANCERLRQAGKDISQLPACQ